METFDPTLAEASLGPARRHARGPGASRGALRQARPVATWATHLDAGRVGTLAAGAAVVFAYLLTQADQGLQGDAHIYMGRAMADLDPLGVGRDAMFAHDGQSAFSAFGTLARVLVRSFGLAATARGLHLAAALAWGAAMLGLVAALRPGKAFAIVAAAALLLPRWYTPFDGLGAGEALAVPRPFAEAAVLVGLALLARGRHRACALALGGAAALHPIMAAPGFGVLLVALVARDRRWALAAAALGAAGLAAAAAGAPLLDRLLVPIDPAFLAILRERSPYLFVGAWPASTYARIVLQLATTLVASVLVEPPIARLLRAVAAVALLGCLVSAACCDGLHLLLFAQAQLWRSLWLLAAVAPLAAGLCLCRLPDLGGRGRLALACLVAAWACFALQPMGALLAIFAATLLGLRRAAFGMAARFTVVSVAGAAALLAVVLDAKAASAGGIHATSVWHLTIWSFAVIAFTVYGTRRPGRIFATVAALVVGPALLVALVVCYDARTPRKASLDAGRIQPDLVALLASRPGEVLWLGGDELWYWTRRPNWSASLQGAGIVFSRDLALLTHDRAEALVDHGLASPAYLAPWAQGVVHRPYAYDRPRIDDLCRRADAPAWVVLPISGEAPLALDADVRVWVPPSEGSADRRDGGAVTRRLIVPCRRR